MCGILGLVSVDRAASSYFDLFDAALNTIKHRGPDNISKLMEQNIALGHTRLSIIDLDERSNQPMTDLSGRFTIIFNGEIYNYQELRSECEEAGYSFRTMSDTEVLQVMYMRMGKKCLDKLNGFFSLGIYDREEKSLFVARDRMGIKPLVYYANDESVTAEVCGEKKILFEGAETSLSASALTLIQRDGYTWRTVNG